MAGDWLRSGARPTTSCPTAASSAPDVIHISIGYAKKK